MTNFHCTIKQFHLKILQKQKMLKGTPRHIFSDTLKSILQIHEQQKMVFEHILQKGIPFSKPAELFLLF